MQHLKCIAIFTLPAWVFEPVIASCSRGKHMLPGHLKFFSLAGEETRVICPSRVGTGSGAHSGVGAILPRAPVSTQSKLPGQIQLEKHCFYIHGSLHVIMNTHTGNFVYSLHRHMCVLLLMGITLHIHVSLHVSV